MFGPSYFGLSYFGDSYFSTGTSVIYAGADAFEALSNWWAANGSALYADGDLWYSEAPEETGLPYCTYFGVSEDPELITTAGLSYRTTVQFNTHAATPGSALALAKQLRNAIKGAPLQIDGRSVWFVRPSSTIHPQVGEGRGPNGSDCWIAGVTFDIPWNE